ncbi:DUF6053 domain-containing protein [Lysobacter enzymogenes]|uniref:DUF6053 domain-containing protein n=1 Tax=Lysobacter enzymogenes TaxID=69 RepID=UPI003D18BAC5
MGGPSVPTLLFQQRLASDTRGPENIGPEGPPTTAACAWADRCCGRDFSPDAFVSAAIGLRHARTGKHRA